MCTPVGSSSTEWNHVVSETQKLEQSTMVARNGESIVLEYMKRGA